MIVQTRLGRADFLEVAAGCTFAVCRPARSPTVILLKQAGRGSLAWRKCSSGLRGPELTGWAMNMDRNPPTQFDGH